MNKISETVIYTALSTTIVAIFVVASFFISFNLPLYVACIVLASIFILKKPEVGLYATILLTAIFGFSFGLLPFEWDDSIYKIYILDILVIVTCLSFLFYKLNNPKVKIKIGEKLGILILVFIAYCFFSMIYGIMSGGSFELAFSTFKNYALYSVFFFLVINIIKTKEKLREVIYVLIIAGILIIPFIFLGLFQGSGLWIEFTPLSTEGTRLLAPNHAFDLCVAIIFTINFVAFRKNIFGKYTIPIVFIEIIGVIGSLTRHLWIALFVGLALSFIFLPKKNKKNLFKLFSYQILFLLLIVIIYALVSFILTQEVKIFGLDYAKDAVIRLQSLFLYSESQDSSIYFRIFSWEKALSLFKESPIVGIGFGHKLSFDVFGWPLIIPMRELHNNFVGIIVQMGILGFLTFVVFNVYFLVKGFSLLKDKSKKYYPYILGAISCYFVFLVAANFGTYFDSNIFVTFYWIFIGVVFVVNDLKNSGEQNL